MARILATGLIFFFHFGGMTGAFRVKHWDTVAILIFVFISGFLGYQSKPMTFPWLKRRFLKILVPYWPIIFVALVLNRIIMYKQTDWLQDIGTFLGLGLFFPERVYVISWFITLILIFYVSLFVYQRLSSVWLKLVWLLAGFVLYIKFIKVCTWYYPGFYLGYFLHSIGWLAHEPYLENNVMLSKLNAYLFAYQSYCYVFFLLHGGFLVLFVRVVHLPEMFALAVVLPTVCVASYFYKNAIDAMVRWAYQQKKVTL
jgi:hypothetical protein